VEWTEGASSGDWAAAAEATTCWRALGVQIGVEHAGSAPEQLPRWRDMGVDYVKVDALHLRGAATNAHVRAYAHSLAGLIRLLGLKAIAEGVEDSADLAVLWQLGYEGATGTALTAPRQLGTEPAVTPERAQAAPGTDVVTSNRAPAPAPALALASASASASAAAAVPAPASASARTAQPARSLTGRSSGLGLNSRPAPLGTR
jgi:EAL domain-containing protein (putative c-di-GMP-specific phosphodiesterase class I)